MFEAQQTLNRKAPRFPVLVVDERAKPVDLLLLSSEEESRKLAKLLSLSNFYVLFHPNPVKLPKSFYKEFFKRKTGRERLSVSKKFGVLKEERIKRIETLILDVDSPFTEVYPVWKELQELLPLSGDIYRTKSGRFRAVIKLSIPLFPERKTRNGKTNYENVKETLEKIGEFFQRHKLNFDRTCVDRLNHPIWLERGEELVLEGEEVNFYRLYGEVKRKLSKHQNIRSLSLRSGESRRKNFFPVKKSKIKGIHCSQVKDSDRIHHSFLAWRIFVKSLSRKYTGRRFFKVMVPAAAAANTLRIDWEIVEETLNNLLSDRNPKKTQKDLETVRKSGIRAKYLPFPDKAKKTAEVIKYIAERGEVPQQELCKKVCFNQMWLTKEIVNPLLEAGILREKREKLTKGRGRKALIFSLNIPAEVILSKSKKEYRKAIKPFPEKYQRLLKEVKDCTVRREERRGEKNLLINSLSTPPVGGYLLKESLRRRQSIERQKGVVRKRVCRRLDMGKQKETFPIVSGKNCPITM